MKNTESYMDILPEISAALKVGKPVVALESTIISHGFPYPVNEKFAIDVQDVVRKAGAVPATTAIINGRIKVGLTPQDLAIMAVPNGALKASRRDLPYVIATQKTAATTVATTMIIAAMAGIKVFATGGIGGVHRGAQQTFDISADLQELAHTNVAVVCAGCKSILDIGLTLEYLETFGVPVLCMGSKKFPAFYCKDSGFEGDYACADATEAAAVIRTKWDLGMDGGVVIANPIPDQWEMDSVRMNKVIADAVNEATAHGIRGKESTPFILAKIKELTGGDSLPANINLAFHNARIAAQIATALSKNGK